MSKHNPRTTDNEADKLTPDAATRRILTEGRCAVRRSPAAPRPAGESGARPAFTGDPDEGENDEDHAEAEEYAAEPPVRGPGHNVMDRAALTAALDVSGFAGNFDHLSSGEEQRVRLLLHYRGSRLFRPHVTGRTAMLERLKSLDAASPNFAVVSRLVLRAAHLSFVSGRPLRIPPILMLGEPGVGKTRYARALAAALDTSLEVITGSTIPDTGSLTGYPPAWRGAVPGRIAKAIVAATTTGPLLFVDECEKIVDHEASAFPLDRLLTLLEPHSASSYEDEHVRVPMRAQHLSWLFAANSLDGVSAPFRDRVVILTIPGLAPEQRDDVLETMLAEVGREAGVPMALAGREALQPLQSLGLRRARLVFEIAIAAAIECGRRFLTTADLRDAAALLGQGSRRQTAGFIHHSEHDG